MTNLVRFDDIRWYCTRNQMASQYGQSDRCSRTRSTRRHHVPSWDFCHDGFDTKSLITRVLERIVTEHIYNVCSLESPLQETYISSVRIRSRNRVMVKSVQPDITESIHTILFNAIALNDARLVDLLQPGLDLWRQCLRDGFDFWCGCFFGL